jgi:hypothetical protein
MTVGQREALFLVGVSGLTYDEAAELSVALSVRSESCFPCKANLAPQLGAGHISFLRHPRNQVGCNRATPPPARILAHEQFRGCYSG